jgi:hypothetical protein
VDMFPIPAGKQSTAVLALASPCAVVAASSINAVALQSPALNWGRPAVISTTAARPLIVENALRQKPAAEVAPIINAAASAPSITLLPIAKPACVRLPLVLRDGATAMASPKTAAKPIFRLLFKIVENVQISVS